MDDSLNQKEDRQKSGRFICSTCGGEFSYRHLAKTGNSSLTCKSCDGRGVVDRLNKCQIERYFELDYQLSEYLSFGKFYSEEMGKYIEYAALWGTRVTDPHLVELMREKHKMLFPEQYEDAGEYEGDHD